MFFPGAAPNVQRCSSTLFSVDSQVIPVGCVVCIPEGARITLNCSGQSESDVSYEWRNGMGRVVSTSPLLTTGTNDNFTCTATNLDNAPEIAVSVVACECKIEEQILFPRLQLLFDCGSVYFDTCMLRFICSVGRLQLSHCDNCLCLQIVMMSLSLIKLQKSFVPLLAGTLDAQGIIM